MRWQALRLGTIHDYLIAARASSESYCGTFTPKHGSWLNMAEIELSHLFRQCLNRRLAIIQKARSESTGWMEERNKNAYVINWQFTATDARIKLKRLYPTIVDDKIKETE